MNNAVHNLVAIAESKNEGLGVLDCRPGRREEVFELLIRRI